MAQDDQFLLHVRFEETARRAPGAIALRHLARSITFAELADSSGRLAGSLGAQGIGGGCVVGVHMERSIDYVTTVLGVLKAHAAVVPLPPSYPPGRLRDILSFASLDLVIDDQDSPLDGGLSGRIAHFADLSAGASADKSEAPPGGADQPAFVLCSSGSTGEPKMIVRSHRSFFHRLGWTWDRLPYGAGEACCQKSYMTTTHAIYELFEPLLAAVPIVIIPDQLVRDLELFWGTLAAEGISRLLIVPSALQASLDMPGFVPPPLRVVVLMGEYVHPRLAERAIAAFPEGTRIFSIYGSTEASSTLVCDLRESFRRGEELPLGTPISPGVRPHVLGADLRQVAPGEVGVLHIGGPALFDGYFRNAALTASVLVDAPDGTGRVYDTRDQVRRLPDGALRFIGRIDDTVKIRGFRVDLQEVERALSLHPDVGQCAVVLSERSAGGASLLGFVTPASADQASIYRHLRDLLPGYMVPSRLVGLDSLPRTASGKVDRRKLLETHEAQTATGAGLPRSDTERRVADVWHAVLQLQDVPRDRSFFEAGGTSLTVFATVHRLREAFALDRAQLSDQAMYHFPTVEALAAYIERVKAGAMPLPAGAGTIRVTLRAGDDSRLAPLFVVAPPGGTLGAYERMAKALETRREIVGLRDPFVWGGRDPTMGFKDWVTLYLDAIRERQSEGPYYIAAYSSAGAFGYEIARRLRQDGQRVALTALIDPLGIDSQSRRRFGYWAFRARFMRLAFGRLVLLGGWLRLPVRCLVAESARQPLDQDALAQDEFDRLAEQAKRSRHHVRAFSVLLELNTGLPFALAEADLAETAPDQRVAVLLARVKQVAPEVEPETIERMVVQYYLQTRAQHRYRLRRFDGKVVVFEPAGPHNGLLFTQFRPAVADLRVVALPLGPQSDRRRRISEVFAEHIRRHYLSMRDDVFARALAEQLAPLLA